jgi:hydroxymethylpyrimidine pyrophosphatase-like HAD family hydrolase
MNSQVTAQTSRVRLVIADVDGTLVTQDKVLTARATEAVKELHDAGILFGITSGRPPRGMRMLIEPLQLTEPLAGFNGGVVVNPDLVPLSRHLLPKDVASEAVQLIVQHGLDVFLYSDLDWFVRDANGPHVAREAWTVQFSPTVIQDFALLMDRVVKVVGVGTTWKQWRVARRRCKPGVRAASQLHGRNRTTSTSPIPRLTRERWWRCFRKSAGSHLTRSPQLVTCPMTY